LKNDINFQRKLLRPCEIEEFDKQWGVDPSGSFATQTSWLGSRKSDVLIQKHMNQVNKEKNARMLKLKGLPDENKGLELLHLFVVDLLGRDTTAANIFLQKSDEDFKTVNMVSLSKKGVACTVLVLLNVFFVYYSMLHGYVKGIQWQRAFLVACIIQLLMEVFVIESIECIWINFVVPNLVTNEIRSALDSLNVAINSLCAASSADSRLFLNAPKYLFVSTNLSQQHPELLESMIIQSYFSYLPGEVSKKWRYNSTLVPVESSFIFRLRHVVVFLSLMLQVFGTTPFLVQKIVIRLTQPIILAGVALAALTIFQSTTNTIIFTLVVFFALCLYGRRIYLMRRKAASADSNIMPVDGSIDESSDDADEEHKSETGSLDSRTMSVISSSSKITPLLDSEVALSSEQDYDESEEEDM